MTNTELRAKALEIAVSTCGQPLTPDRVLACAEKYYEFLLHGPESKRVTSQAA